MADEKRDPLPIEEHMIQICPGTDFVLVSRYCSGGFHCWEKMKLSEIPMEIGGEYQRVIYREVPAPPPPPEPRYQPIGGGGGLKEIAFVLAITVIVGLVALQMASWAH